jgi:hypothetical protein
VEQRDADDGGWGDGSVRMQRPARDGAAAWCRCGGEEMGVECGVCGRMRKG